MIYFDNRLFEKENLYELYILKKYLTKHYDEEKAIALIKMNSHRLDDLAMALV